MEVEESFDELFKEWDYENSQEILPLVRKCISMSSNEREVLRALEISLCFCLKKFSVDDLEEEVFLTMCPVAKKIVFEKLNYSVKNPTGCVESLAVSHKILSYLERVFEYLDEIPKISMIEIRSLLTTTSEILLGCFSHCKTSEEVYGALFSSLTECLTNFFKEVCRLQEQLLHILTEKAECDPEDDREILLLDEIMISLSKLGIILINLEVKTMAKVWKAFAFLIEKHLCCLKSNHNIGETITNLCSSIISNIETGLFRNNQDFSKTIKLNCFLLKLIIKFCDVFTECLQNCQNSLINLLLILCKYDACLGSEEKYGTTINQDLVNQLTIGTNPLLSQLIRDVGFVKECCAVGEDVKKSIEFSILCCLIINKLLDSISVTRSLWFNKNENILEWILLSASSSQFLSCSNIYLPNILINGKQKKFTDLYEYVLVTTSAFLMTVTADEYRLVEKTLIESVLQEKPVRALLAIDIWCLLARFGDSELCLSQILTLSKMLQEIHPHTLRVEKCYLTSLIQRLFPLLAGSHRVVFLRSFQPSFYYTLWDRTSVDGVTPSESCQILQDLFTKVGSLLDQDGFEASYLETGVAMGCQNVMYEKFGSKILKLWKFDCETLPKTSGSAKFMKILCCLTACIVSEIPLENLFMVLTQVKNLLAIGQPTCVKLCFIWILNSLSTVRIPPGNFQKEVIAAIAEIFRDLLLSKEVLTKQKALETFYSFSHITSHGEVISMSVQNAPELKVEITNYFKRKRPDQLNFSLKEFMSELYQLKFQHVCPELESDLTVVPKKMKFNPVNMHEIVIRWKEDGKAIVECFQSLSESEKREIQNVCNSILSLPL